MCKINCSGGCVDCAPDENAAGMVTEWLESRGYVVSTSFYEDLSQYLADQFASGDIKDPQKSTRF